MITTNQIINRIATSCNMPLDDAEQELNANINYLRELQELNDLRYSDIIQVCQDLGLESDFDEYFLSRLTY